MNRTAVRNIALEVVILFVLACFLPCIDCGPPVPSSDPGDTLGGIESGWHLGLTILLFGGGGGNDGVPWSANLFLAQGVVFLWSGWVRTAAVMGAIASILGLTTWWVCGYDTLLPGYYFWQASQFVLLGGALQAMRRSER